MQGRLEHEIRINNNISALLENAPKEVIEFYYNLQVSKEPTTCLEYIRKILNFIKYTKKSPLEITNLDISKYLNSVNYINKNGELVRTSSSYRQGIWSAINQFYNFLYLNKKIDFNPITSISRPKTTDNVRRISLSMQELNQMLLAVENGAGNARSKARQAKWKERDKLILFLFMNTGMRKTALSEININDINYSDNTLTIIDKRNKIQIYGLTNEMKICIDNWLIKRDSFLNGKKEDALFISSNLKRMNEKSIYNIVKKYSEEALGYSISPHKLRASFVSLYYEASGHDIKATCQAVGHANIATTSLYIVKGNDARKDAINFMSKNLKI